MKEKPKTSRTGEIVLGILGGVFGLVAAVLEMGVSAISSATGNNAGLTGLTVGMLIASIMAIMLPFFISKNRVLIGWLSIVAGVAMFICAGGFGIFCGVLTIIGGVLTLVRK